MLVTHSTLTTPGSSLFVLAVTMFLTSVWVDSTWFIIRYKKKEKGSTENETLSSDLSVSRCNIQRELAIVTIIATLFSVEDRQVITVEFHSFWRRYC